MEAARFDPPRRRAALDETWTPVVAFVAAYCAAIAAAFLVAPPSTTAAAQSVGLVAVLFASVAAPLAIERRIADPALVHGVRPAARAFVRGLAIGAVAVGTGHLAVLASSGLVSGVVMERGAGVPWAALAMPIVPAVLHEELLFRGYAFQKLLARSPVTAVAASATIFAALHAGNRAVGALAFVNLALAGVLLGLTFVLVRSLWAPIGVHFAWNVLSGPILGHEISGWEPPSTLFFMRDPGPDWITGGGFGIEASVWMTLVQAALITWLAWHIRNGPGFGPVDTIRHWTSERNPS